MENLRDVQLVEAQHAKERFELEMVAYEEIESKKVHNQNLQDVMKLRHMNELHAEKEKVLTKKEETKEIIIRGDQSKEIERKIIGHRAEIKKLNIDIERRYKILI